TGPCAQNPQYYTMTYGTDISQLICPFSSTDDKKLRIVSGNILTGKQLSENMSVRFYDSQITVIGEGGKREFIGWLLPGLKKWSFSHTFLAFLSKKRKYDFDTTMHGEKRNFVMTDIYEKVFPFDILPMELLKACLIKDVELMEDLGIYEVDDEDFALCEVVCPSKTECQKIIREGLFTVKNS
ncbi:MAG: NADH:ubiquinone reductase (Na(+)-transporting) subunit A, partial [Bacteroidales bacterium]|nr:NADH:ubiquinone reductase (Na(+)-transporting) subunit A [Bacteroidales bacterium]